jgi:hypothetical protein
VKSWLTSFQHQLIKPTTRPPSDSCYGANKVAGTHILETGTDSYRLRMSKTSSRRTRSG